MAQPTTPQPVKLICGLIAGDEALFAEAETALAEAFGAIDLRSEVVDFDLTDYYAQQMGQGLLRRFVTFEPLSDPGCLAAAKHRTNAIEAEIAARHADGPPRPANLDVGYLTPARLILASMKDFAHRVYVGQGVYAEVTIQFRDGEWRPLEWTFPDYASGRYDAFLTLARQRLCEQLHPETQG